MTLNRKKKIEFNKWVFFPARNLLPVESLRSAGSSLPSAYFDLERYVELIRVPRARIHGVKGGNEKAKARSIRVAFAKFSENA